MLAVGLLALFWWADSVISTPDGNSTTTTDLPNIVIIFADDLGWNDVSFHGSDQFQTPNIDALAYSGVIMHNYYTQPICTPSRAALLSGRHPINNGMEHDVIYAPQPWGLPLSERLMPEYLKDLGYTTRAVGKWHLGFFKANYTPTRRGFDSHYGVWLGHQDHYSHMGFESHPGFDFRRGLNVSWETSGKYSTDLFTEEAEDIIANHDTTRPLFLYMAHTAPHAPLQAPADLISKFSYIKTEKRRKFAAMVTKLDESVGRVTQALKAKNILNNTIILFLSDNGGATNGFNGNVASNWPLRGGKDTLWEGGVRGVGLIWSPLLQATPRVHKGLVNVQDWVPTLLSATGASDMNAESDLRKLDGVSQWAALNNQAEPPYHNMLHNIDNSRKIGAIRNGRWKLVTGRTYRGQFDGFYGHLEEKIAYTLDTIRDSAAGRAVQDTPSPLPSDKEVLSLRADATVSCTPSFYSSESLPHVIQVRQAVYRTDNLFSKSNDTSKCKPHLAPCLFDMEEDPCETENVAAVYPEIVNQMVAMLKAYQPVTPNNQPDDPRSYPTHWNNTWTTWQDFV